MLESYDSIFPVAECGKILIFSSDVDELLAEVHKEGLHTEFHIIRGSPHPFFVEFLVRGVSKGSSVKLLCDHLDLKSDEVVAFGDGDNDREMLQFAGIGVAMKNAKDVLKEVADVVLEVRSTAAVAAVVAVSFVCVCAPCLHCLCYVVVK